MWFYGWDTFVSLTRVFETLSIVGKGFFSPKHSHLNPYGHDSPLFKMLRCKLVYIYIIILTIGVVTHISTEYLKKEL